MSPKKSLDHNKINESAQDGLSPYSEHVLGPINARIDAVPLSTAKETNAYQSIYPALLKQASSLSEINLGEEIIPLQGIIEKPEDTTIAVSQETSSLNEYPMPNSPQKRDNPKKVKILYVFLILIAMVLIVSFGYWYFQFFVPEFSANLRSRTAQIITNHQ